MNMLRITLPEAAENDKLVELGHFRINVERSSSAITTDTNYILFDARDAGIVVKIIGDGSFLQSDMTTVIPGNKITIAADSPTIYFSNGNYQLDISSKYGIYRFTIGTNAYIDASQDGVFTRLERIGTSNKKSTLSLSSLQNSGSLQSAQLGNSGVSGDVSVLKNKAYFRYCTFTNCKDIVGDIGNLGTCPLIENIVVSGTGLTGSIEDFGNCKSIGNINVAGTQVTGSLANLAAAMAANGRTSGTLTYTDKNGVSSSVTFPYNP